MKLSKPKRKNIEDDEPFNLGLCKIYDKLVYGTPTIKAKWKDIPRIIYEYSSLPYFPKFKTACLIYTTHKTSTNKALLRRVQVVGSDRTFGKFPWAGNSLVFFELVHFLEKYKQMTQDEVA